MRQNDTLLEKMQSVNPEIRSRASESRCQALMCKAFHGRSGRHLNMLLQGLKCLAQQSLTASGGVLLRILRKCFRFAKNVNSSAMIKC